MPVCAPPKFKILVANILGASDPAGLAGNAVKIRTGFELQMVHMPNGTGRIAGPIQAIPPTTAISHTVSIRVLSNTFWDPTVAAPPPFYPKEEIQVFDRFLTASEDFAVGMGSAAGGVNAIAASIATAVQGIEGVTAISVGDTAYITSRRLDGYMPVKASNDTAVVLAAYDFRVQGPAGEILTVAPLDRKTYFMVKVVKSQGAPISLP